MSSQIINREFDCSAFADIDHASDGQLDIGVILPMDHAISYKVDLDSTNWKPLPQWTKADGGLLGPIIHIAGTKVRMPKTHSDQLVAQQQEFVDGLIAAKWRRNVVRPLALGLAITIAISLAIHRAERTKSDGATKQSGGMTYRLGWSFIGLVLCDRGSAGAALSYGLCG